MDRKRGQSAIEFMVLAGAVLFFTVVFLVSIQFNTSDRLREQRDVMIKEIAFTVQDEIALAHNSIDGYSRNFTLPPKISGEDYNIEIRENWVFINTSDRRHSAGFPILEVEGQVTKGDNRIRKDNGVVCLNIIGDCPP